MLCSNIEHMSIFKIEETKDDKKWDNFLSTSIRINAVDSASNYYLGTIVTTNRNYQFIFDPDFGQDATRMNVSFSVLADMSATHTAGVSILQVSGTSQTDIATESYFSGHLVA